MGFVAPRLAFSALLAVTALALGAMDAHAYDFTVTPSSPNPGQPATFQLTPTSAAVERVRWDLDGDGAFDDGNRTTATRTYSSPGPVTVSMRARETKDSDEETVTKTIRVNGRPAADFGFTPADPIAGESVAFTPAVTDPDGDDVTLEWDFGDGGGSSAGAPTYDFASAGTYDVVLTATDENGAVTSVTHRVRVAEDPGPAPSFAYTPSQPVDGDAIKFTSTSTPSQGSIKTVEWDFDADGVYDAVGPEVEWAFGVGVHQVTIRVTQENGRQAVGFADVEVAERPPPPDPGPPGPSDPGGGAAVTTPVPKPKPKPPTRMRPFPVVRIAGVVLPHGALVRILSVRAPRGARVLARCRGKGCPVGSVARSSVASLVRLHRFESRLPAGVRLELFVRKAGRIGKYTRFLIRAGRPPARVDRCLMPGRSRPVRCP